MRPRSLVTAVVLALAAGATALVVTAPAPAAAKGGAGELAGITEFVVRIDPAVTTIVRVNQIAGTTTIAASVGLPGSYLVRIPSGADPAVVEQRLTSAPGVVWVNANSPIVPPEVDQTRIYAWRIYAWQNSSPIPAAGAYAPAAVQLKAAHTLSKGAGTVVAVLDTGVQLSPRHAGLGSALVAGIDLVGHDAVPAETSNRIDDDKDGLIDEGRGHGTHVAGIVHQAAPLASIMPVRVLDDDGSGSMWTVAEGMYWAAAHGADVINLSLGTHGSATPLKEAARVVIARGVVVVAAAGNDGKDRTMFPAAVPAAIAVTSVGKGDVVSTFSNIGRWVDVSAPGQDIHSTYAFPAGSYATNSGTSMATPWVAGEAALILAKRPAFTPAQVAGAIARGAVRIDAINPRVAGRIGAGRIDMAASLRSI